MLHHQIFESKRQREIEEERLLSTTSSRRRTTMTTGAAGAARPTPSQDHRGLLSLFSKSTSALLTANGNSNVKVNDGNSKGSGHNINSPSLVRRRRRKKKEEGEERRDVERRRWSHLLSGEGQTKARVGQNGPRLLTL